MDDLLLDIGLNGSEWHWWDQANSLVGRSPLWDSQIEDPCVSAAVMGVHS